MCPPGTVLAGVEVGGRLLLGPVEVADGVHAGRSGGRDGGQLFLRLRFRTLEVVMTESGLWKT